MDTDTKVFRDLSADLLAQLREIAWGNDDPSPSDRAALILNNIGRDAGLLSKLKADGHFGEVFEFLECQPTPTP